MFRPDSVRILSVLAIAAFPFSHVQAQTTLYVNNGDVKANNAGLGKLPGPPLRTIQRAIDLSANGDEIVVFPGTYNEMINLAGKAITIRRSDGSGVATIDATSLGGPVVRYDSGADANTVLDGFTLTGGTGRLHQGALRGGGMFIVDSSPTIQNCILLSNRATNGGGVFISGGSPTFVNCVFDGNEATRIGGGMEVINGSRASLTDCTFNTNKARDGNGGGIRSEDSNLFLTRCEFSGNTASERGGGISSVHSNHAVTDCGFVNNSSGLEGGGMFNTSSSPLVTRTRFIGNVTTNGSGGGMYNTASSPTVANCVFSGNRANGNGNDGGGMYNTGNSNPTVVNSSFAGNSAASRGGGIANRSGVTILTNCILWNNSAASSSPQVFNDWVTVIRFSNVQGSGGSLSWVGPIFGTDDGGNIDDSPLFVDANGTDNIVGTLDDDLRLLFRSPAIDAGFGFGSLLDLDGHIRIVDDPATPDTGVGLPVVIDMGAYEFGSDAPTGDPDVDLDGDVDLFDFALMEVAFTGPPVLPDPVCGNGVLEFGETCDDENTQNGDGCDENCEIESPTNDNCVDAIELFNGTTPFNSISATLDGPAVSSDCDPIDGTTQIPADVWFRYVTTCDGTVEVNLCGSDYDAKLAVYDGTTCPPTTTELGCDDDGCDVSSLDSVVTNLAVTIGQVLSIRIGGYTSQSQGTGTLDLSCTEGTCNPAAGACYDANGSPGCADPSCCDLVCPADPPCCDRTWDDACADRAAAVCGLNCGAAGVLINNNACDTVADPLIDSPEGGCSDEQTCRDVCAIESDCCRFSWDLKCVCLADPSDLCCQAICTTEPSCCTTGGWTPACDAAASNLPAVCPP